MFCISLSFSHYYVDPEPPTPPPKGLHYRTLEPLETGIFYM